MNFYKTLTKSFVVCLLTVGFATSSFAMDETKNNKEVRVLYQKDEEKDLNKLFEKAKNKVSEVDLSSLPIETNAEEVSTAQILNIKHKVTKYSMM
ncbi:hypothetical protein M3196_15065 [Fictibacillus nanhaiensis]|uniref:hypothetical protein n=1 Tax=Fictibacillus nanhaiensis TaxID=742169 RepID=UPI00204014C9|nr:hypothetical protein [Fictibacillus nanhaiensis]MCM3732973.1 hypothetical protein [Fictibacillus nanhaiensis]